tara:strand:+ start:436 stop:834 length:399 start_codon:yes stop_codon:yes gene_type:complete
MSKDLFGDVIVEQDDNNPYTQKVGVPVYEPRGQQPSIHELIDTHKSLTLIREIEMNDAITNDEKVFLVASAKRHNIFNFEKCADYYAHATPAMKHLMERSGLVIVDLNKAIENGFVTMNEDLAEQFRREQDD